MREIEIKASADAGIIATLEANGWKFSSVLSQHDRVFYYPTQKLKSPFVRLRIENNQTATFNMKKSKDNELDAIEYETIVADPDATLRIMEHLGLELYAEVNKQRRKAKKGDIELCVDEVVGLGSFIEAEKLCSDDADGDKVRRELWALFESYGISRAQEVSHGYDTLVRLAKGLKKL